MVAAYAYADGGGQMPDELILSRTVDKYGAQAVFGRTLSFQEIRSMSLSENVYSAYQERARSENWAQWAEANPGKARLINAAGMLYEEIDNG
jgi:hypothetical protein